VKLIVSRAAAADIERLRAFLKDKNPVTAQRVAAVLTDAIQSLDTFPDRGRPSGTPGARELIVPFGRSAYVLRYAHDAQRARSLFSASGTGGRRASDGPGHGTIGTLVEPRLAQRALAPGEW